MPRKQYTFRLPDDVLEELDRLVDAAKARGERHPENRTEALIGLVDKSRAEAPKSRPAKSR